jgi:hypothetical protein
MGGHKNGGQNTSTGKEESIFFDQGFLRQQQNTF